jgi:hypothetical protein
MPARLNWDGYLGCSRRAAGGDRAVAMRSAVRAISADRIWAHHRQHPSPRTVLLGLQDTDGRGLSNVGNPTVTGLRSIDDGRRACGALMKILYRRTLSSDTSCDRE